MWVADYGDDKIYAYVLATKMRDASKDFDTLSAAGNENPYDIWSDNITMWVADYDDAKLYAYNMATKARDAGKDITTAALSAGIWSDGTTMWVAKQTPAQIHAYTLATGVRDAGKDFDTLKAAQNHGGEGIWANTDTMWVADLRGRQDLLLQHAGHRHQHASRWRASSNRTERVPSTGSAGR